MDHLYGLGSLPVGDSCVAFGSFDGLHIGHRTVMDSMAEFSSMQKVLLSFERTDGPIFLTEPEKAFLLRNGPVDCLVSVPEKEMTDLSAEVLIQTVLVGKLHARAVVCGEHSAMREELLTFSRNGAFQLVSVPAVCSDGFPVNRALLTRRAESGPFHALLDLLGHPYILRGTVTHGKGLGRTQDMPTVNVRFPQNKILPPYGVYASLVHLKDGVRTGLTNIGPRPSVDDSPDPTVETYILDYEGDLYGQELTLEIRDWIRGIQKFDGGLKEVTEQVRRDEAYVRNVLNY